MSAILVADIPSASLRRRHPVEVQYEPDSPGSGTMAIRYRGTWQVYRVTEIGADPDFGGRAFRVRKSNGETYTVQVHRRNAALHRCDCADGVYAVEQRGAPCKHAAALSLALERGIVDCEPPEEFDPREIADELDQMAAEYGHAEPGGGGYHEDVAPSLPAATHPHLHADTMVCPTCGRKHESGVGS